MQTVGALTLDASYSQKKELAAAVKETIKDPVLFCERWLGVQLWSRQREILKSIRDNRRTVVKACHASSKSFSAACAVLWFLAAHTDEAMVLTTAPTGNQVEKILWAEINNIISRANKMPMHYPFPKANLAGIRLDPKRYAAGFSTSVENGDEGVKFHGFHAKNALVILDEAPGIEGAIWGAIEGVLSAGNTSLLALGNPTIASGPFYDAFGENAHEYYRIDISAFDTPNFEGVYLRYREIYRDIDAKECEREIIHGDPNGRNLLELSDKELDDNPLPYLVGKRWVKDKFYSWGPRHPHFLARVLGRFPSQHAESMYSQEDLERARREKYSRGGRVVVGIDVAGPGEDETVAVFREDDLILEICAFQEQDPRGLIAKKLKQYGERIDYINCDAQGLGYYFALHFEDLKYKVNHINAQSPPRDKEQFADLKTEFYWDFRLRLEAGRVFNLYDQIAFSQLAGIRYKPTSRGTNCVESKENARKRGVKSPDRAEAIILAFAPNQMHGLIQLWRESAEQQHKEGKTYKEPSLNEAQKTGSDKWMDFISNNKNRTKMQNNKSIQKVTVNPKTEKCPSCGSHMLSHLVEDSWRCGACQMDSRRWAQQSSQSNEIPPIMLVKV